MQTEVFPEPNSLGAFICSKIRSCTIRNKIKQYVLLLAATLTNMLWLKKIGFCEDAKVLFKAATKQSRPMLAEEPS